VPQHDATVRRRAHARTHHRAPQRPSNTAARFAGRPLPAASERKRLECPQCRKPCSVTGGRAAELPTNYDIVGRRVIDSPSGPRDREAAWIAEAGLCAAGG
jgi:hypothetical protein